MASLFEDGRFIVLFFIVLLRYLIIAAIAFLIFYQLKRQAWTYKKIQLRFPISRDYIREILYSVVTAVIFTLVGYLIFMTPFRTFTKLYTQLDEYGLSYFFFSIILMLLIHDTYFYWTHRAMHHPRLFAILHRVHHLSTNPSPWAAFAFHPLEAVVEAGIILVLALIMPVHAYSIALFLLFMILTNVSQVVDIQLQTEVVSCYIKLMNLLFHFHYLALSFLIQEFIIRIGFIRDFLHQHVPYNNG